MQPNPLESTQLLHSAKAQPSPRIVQKGLANLEDEGQFDKVLQADQQSQELTDVEMNGNSGDGKTETESGNTQLSTLNENSAQTSVEQPVLLNFQFQASKAGNKNRISQPDPENAERVAKPDNQAGLTDSASNVDVAPEEAILIPINQAAVQTQIRSQTSTPDGVAEQHGEVPDDAERPQPESDPMSERNSAAEIKNSWQQASEDVSGEMPINAADEALLPINETVIVESPSRIVSQLSTQPLPPTTPIEVGGITNQAKSGAPTLVASPAAVPQQVAETFVKEILVSTKQGAKTLTMQLHPAELGKLTVEIGWENDNVTASIVASDKATSEMLNRDRQWLVNNLAQNGYELSSFEVTHEGSKRDQGTDDMFGARSGSDRGKESRQSGGEVNAVGKETDQDAAETERLTQSILGTGSVVNLVA